MRLAISGESWRRAWGLTGLWMCFSHSALILLLDGGSSPQGVDTIHCHGHAEVWLWLPALQPQLLYHCPHHITAALHTSDTLRQETPTEAWIQCLRKGNQRELKGEFHWFYISKSVYRLWGEHISEWKMHRNLLWLKRVLCEVRYIASSGVTWVSFQILSKKKQTKKNILVEWRSETSVACF